MRLVLVSLCLVASVFTSACTWKRAYDIAQAVQAPQCIYISDMQDREHCTKTRAMSYDAYESERRKLRP